MQRIAGTGAIPDTSFSSVVCLLLCNGINAATSFPDHSFQRLSVTAEGNAQVSGTSPKFGYGSCLLDGTGDDLLLPANTLLNLNADFTVEGWLKSTQNDIAPVIIADAATLGLYFNSRVLSVYDGSSHNATSNLGDGNWHHFAWSRTGSTHYLFSDGTQENTWSNSSTFSFSSQRWGFQASSKYFNGSFYGLRITRVCRYTGSFTAPTLPFPIFGA